MNTTVKVVLASIAGTLIGAGAGYFVTRKVYEKRCQEQVDEIKEYYKEKYEGTKEEVKEDDIYEQSTDEEVNKESEKKQSKETIVTSAGDDDRPLNNYSKCSSVRSNYIKPKQEDKNVAAVGEITKEEFDDYDGDADIYRHCWWYEGDSWLVNNDNYQKVFRQDKEILKFFANYNWEWDEGREEYSEVYIQLAPGVSGLDDGALCRVNWADCGYFETDDPYELDNIWVDTCEDCEFGKAAVADIRGDLGSGCYDPDDHKANGAV